MRDRSLRSGERQVGPTLSHVEEWHRWRYSETLQYIEEKIVLDVGCGVGYGSYIMAAKAIQICAIDDSYDAILFAREHYQKDNIMFMHLDALRSLEGMHIDIVVAFEVIEHIQDTDQIFKNFAAINPEMFIISTPHLKCPIAGNKFHHRHYGMDELIDRFWNIGYRPERAELRYFGKGLCNFLVVKKEL